MRIAFLLSFLFLLQAVMAISIPKKVQGQYEAEMPSFTFEHNDEIISASGYRVSLVLMADYLWYYCGDMKFYGSYSSLKEEGSLLVLVVNISNEMSVSFDMNLSINRRTNSIIISGLEGVPETKLEKKRIAIEKKPTH